MVPLWPFTTWGVDVIGPISPNASNGHCFILEAINYFTKWVKAALYANVTQKVVKKFLERDIIYCYDLSETFITNNAQNLNGSMV